MSNRDKIRFIKQKLLSKLPTSTEDKERMKHACSTAVIALRMTLDIVQQVAGNAGTPGLQAGIKGLILFLDVVQKMSQNAQSIEQLGRRIDDLMMLLQNAKDRGMLSENILGRIDRLSTKWTPVADEVQKMASRRFFGRIINYSNDVQLINDHVQTITWSMESFTVESMLAIEFTLDKQSYAVHRIEGKLDNVVQKVDIGFQQLNAKLDAKDGHPPHAVLARFDCKARTRCLEGTRADILEQVDKWINGGDVKWAKETAPRNLPVFWINGTAGTGKTTIAYTVAETCSNQKILGASFFCSRDDAECSNANLIFPTIAYQLGLFFSPFQAEVTRALKANPDICYSAVPHQLEELIVKPLRAVGESFPSCIVVLDALDECKESGAISVILSSLSRYIGKLSPLKILVTSRPERNITLPFSNQLSPTTQKLILHEVELEVVQNDIEDYFTANLALVRKFYHLDHSWPSLVDIRALVLLSSGLFIFASTSIKFIEDKKYCNPRRQLVELLRNTAETTNSSLSPHRHLDKLYMDVLTHAFPDLSSVLASLLKMVLGTIILLRDPLSPIALEQLLSLKEGTVRETLVCLHSVVIVPDDDDQVIRLHHPSFFDFMTSPARCLNSKLVVNTKIQHTLLARACLNIMKDLRRDICGIENFQILNNEVKDLQTRIARHIPPQLQYACRHWAFHLANGMISDVLLDLTREFCSKYLLCWVEVCSLLGDLRSALLALDSAQKVLANMEKSMTDVSTLLHDCERFINKFFSILSTSSLQVYHSALLLTPSETLIYKTYQHKLILPVKIYNASERTWDSCLRIMDGHSDAVRAVAFSLDGARIVSASDDKTLRLWDAVSGTHLQTFEGHSRWVTTVAFSPDGTRLVSGSGDKAVCLWDAVSGIRLRTLKGHNGGILAVAFSPDGALIASGSGDNTLRLWDAPSGAHIKTLRGHSDWVYAVAFSQDGTRIVSGARDQTVLLWDAASGTHLQTLEGHSGYVRTVGFSPDGTRIVSGSEDNTLRLWNAINGVHLSTLEGHSDFVRSVSFSPNGSLIVSGSEDNTLRLWDATSGTHLNTLKGHSEWVNAVAFSPDGSRVASGSRDQTVRLWAAVSDTHLDTLKGHSGYVRSVALSPDGTRAVSGSEDKTLCLWDAGNGAHLHTLRGHSEYVLAVAFSPDSTRVVSGSEDSTIRLWDVVSGTHLHTLEGHSDYVRSVAFSRDGAYVISGSYDETLRLWDARAGVHLDTTKGHWGSATSVAARLTPSQLSLSQYNPVDSTAAEPASGYIVEGEWVCSLPQKRRLCWLPASCRPYYPHRLDWIKDLVALGTNDGRVVIINFTGINPYLNTLTSE